MAKYIDLEKVEINYGCVAHLPPDPVIIAQSLYAQLCENAARTSTEKQEEMGGGMERLTKRTEYGLICNSENCPKHAKGECNDGDDCREVLLERLAAYEDTGLTPKQCSMLKQKQAKRAEFLDAVLREIYSYWGCDPAYFSASKDEIERTMARHDMSLIEFIELLKERESE